MSNVRTAPDAALAGMSVLVTRPEGSADGLVRALQAHGAAVTYIPAIRTVAPPSYAALDAALAQLETYAWIVFTSASGVRFTALRLLAHGLDPRAALGACRVAVIGTGTEHELAHYAIVPALVPPEAVGESLRDALLHAGAGTGTRVLLPQPLAGRDVVASGLRAAGATVDVVPAYQTLTNTEGGGAIARWLNRPGAKAALVTSPSTVRGLLAMLDGDRERLARLPLVCIGPVTAAAVTELGGSPAFVAAEHTNDGLMAALIAHAQLMKGAPAA